MAPTNSLLSRLPVDIVPNILRHTDIESVRNLKVAVEQTSTSTAVVRECNRRLSPIKYLDESIGRGADILDAMTDCNAYIMGLRALEFFAPGTVNPNDSWDICVSYRNGAALTLMELLTDTGFVWYTAEDEINLLLSGSICTLMVDVLKYTAMSDNLLLAAKEQGYSTEVQRPYSEMLEMSEKKCLAVRPGVVNDDPALFHSRWIVNGHMTKNGVKMPARIIGVEYGDDNSAVSLLLEYESSCLQAFLGPHCACHLYGKLACNRDTYGWQDNIVYTDSDKSAALMSRTVPAWKELADRRFNYVDTPATEIEHLTRTVGDGGCTWVTYSPRSAGPFTSLDYNAVLMKDITWYETPCGVGAMPCSTETPYRAERGHYETSKYHPTSAATLLGYKYLPCLMQILEAELGWSK